MSDGEALVRALRNPDAYPHTVHDLRVLETHISWVILTGEYAYKIKKPIRLAFLDFSTLELRKRCCEEEIRLNRRWAPSLYLDVVPVTGDVNAPRVSGQGSAIEYAVRMLQFPQSALLSSALADGRLDARDMLELAAMIADRHQSAPATRSSRYGGPDAVMKPMRENFPYLEPYLAAEQLARLEQSTEATVAANRANLIARSESGFVRECHGDLHLRNLVRLSDGIVAFDCIEFSDELRMLDVISDLSFLTMDLVAASRPDLANVLVNRYLECTGDYEGMILYRLYFIYHCLIRAKVEAIRASERDDAEEARVDIASMRHYVDVALSRVDATASGLVVMHGLSGSGKTRVSGALVECLDAIRLRSDIERKRLYGLEEHEDSGSAPGSGLYDHDATRNTYERLFTLARCLLEAGHTVIIDAAFLKRAERAQAARVAESCGVPFVALIVDASRDLLVQRLTERQDAGLDASEADVEVLDMQLQIVEVPTLEEPGELLRFANDEGADTAALCASVAHCLRAAPS